MVRRSGGKNLMSPHANWRTAAYHMLELYEQNRVPLSQGSEVEGSGGGGSSHRTPGKSQSVNKEQASKQVSSRPMPDHLSADHHGMPPRSMQNQNNENGSVEMGVLLLITRWM